MEHKRNVVALHGREADARLRRLPQQKQPVTLSDVVVSYLETLGVEYVFGIPGGAIEPLYNAFARSERRGGLRAITVRHETSGAFAADGYHVATGKLGVVCATTGPGATNLVTGIASAQANRVPLLVLTAQTPLASHGRGAFQESTESGTDVIKLFEPITVYNSMISHPEQLENKLITAVMAALEHRGPAHLSLPADILGTASNQSSASWDLSRLTERSGFLDEASLQAFATRLYRARRPVFVIGDQSRLAIEEILDTAAVLNAEILTTPHGKGLVSPWHPRYRGVVGFAGHKSAVRLLAAPDVDMIVAVGTRLGDWETGGWDEKLLLNERLVHVEAERMLHARAPMASLHVAGDLQLVFSRVLTALQSANRSAQLDTRPYQLEHGELKFHFDLDDPAAYVSNSAPLKPQRLMRELPRLFPPATRYFADTGASFAWAIHYLHPAEERHKTARSVKGPLFRTCLEFASMGWAIGAVLGASLADRRPVVCITGDGSVLMSGQEFTVAVQERLPIVFVVLNDGALGMVKHGQRLTGAEPIGYDLPLVNFAAVARAMGGEGVIVREPRDLYELDVQSMIDRDGPTLIDVRIDPAEIPPIGTRIRSLANV